MLSTSLILLVLVAVTYGPGLVRLAAIATDGREPVTPPFWPKGETSLHFTHVIKGFKLPREEEEENYHFVVQTEPPMLDESDEAPPIPSRAFVSWPSVLRPMKRKHHNCVETWTRCAGIDQVVLLTDDFMDALVHRHFSSLEDAYRMLPKPIMRVDLARLLALYYYGGVYVDMDICLWCERRNRAIETITRLRNDSRAKFPNTRPLGVSNDLMMAPPRHPFVWRVIDRLVVEARLGPLGLGSYWDVMCGTGPSLLSLLLWAYPGDDVVRLDRYGALPDSSLPLVRHTLGKSWQESDGIVLVSLYDSLRTLWWTWIPIALAAGCLGGVVLASQRVLAAMGSHRAAALKTV